MIRYTYKTRREKSDLKIVYIKSIDKLRKDLEGNAVLRRRVLCLTEKLC